MKRAGALLPGVRLVPFAAFAGLFAFHFALVCRWTIDLPFQDDWDELVRPYLGSWIFAQHNEHRIVTTRLTNWAYYHLDHWNLHHIQIGNFLLYGGLLLFLYIFVRRFAPTLPGWLLILFVTVCLSPVAIQNHLWAFQMQWHYVLLFQFAAAYALFSRQSLANAILGAAMGVLCIYSLSSGAVSLAVLWLIYSAFKAKKAMEEKRKSTPIFWQWFIVTAAWGVSLAFYAHGYLKPLVHPPYIWPWNSLFWDYYCTLLSHGFGWNGHLLPVSSTGAFVLALLAGPWLISLATSFGQADEEGTGSLAIAATGLGVLAALASITVGRAGFGVDQADTSRYAEFVLVTMPLMAASWWLLLKARATLQVWVSIALCLLCLVALGREWPQFADYQGSFARRSLCIAPLRQALRTNRPLTCPSLRGVPIGVEQLKTAKRYRLAFAENLLAGHAP